MAFPDLTATSSAFALASIDSLSQAALSLGLASARVTVAMLLLPLFSQDIVPAMVRNALCIAIALLCLWLQPGVVLPTLHAGQWLILLAKEAFIGAVLGFFFSGLLWAFEAAGQLVDTKVGSTQAQVNDPISGQQVTLNAAFLGRLAGWVFMAGGGFMVFVGALIESYSAWPVAAPLPPLDAAGARLFETEFGRIMALTLAVAAPALLLLYLIDLASGLLNRYAQQLNVTTLASSLKGIAATWILWVQLASMAKLLQDDLLGRGSWVLRTARTLLGG